MLFRSKPELWDSEKERLLMKPGDNEKYYSTLSQICIENCIGVDIFAGGSNMDLSTLSKIVSDTGGELYHYQDFELSRFGEKLYFDLFRNLTRNTVYDVSLKARCSYGLSITKYIGGFGEKYNYVVDITKFDADKTISFGIGYDEDLKPNTFAFIQFAIAFTNSMNQRRVRIFNYRLIVIDKPSKLYNIE